MRLPNPELERTDIRLLPLQSGYRDPETQELRFTTFYDKVLDQLEHPRLNHLRAGDFEVVVPVSQVCSSHLFDLEAYEYFLMQGEEKDPQFVNESGHHLSKEHEVA